MISCVILSAGFSERFGSPKALANINGKTNIAFLLEKLIKCNLSEIVVVLGFEHEKITQHVFKHNLLNLVYNKDYKFGQTTSVIAGLKKTSTKSDEFLILPIDCPFVRPQTVDQLIVNFKRNTSDILIPMYQNRRGHPPVFNQKVKDAILKLDIAKGINTVLKDETYTTNVLDTDDPGVTETFNTPEELNEILKLHNSV